MTTLSRSEVQKHKLHDNRFIQPAGGGQLTPVRSDQCHRLLQATAGYISSYMWSESGNQESLIPVVPFFIGMAVGIPTTIVGIPLWVIGGIKKSKAEITIKIFDIKPENSMAAGIGITLRL